MSSDFQGNANVIGAGKADFNSNVNIIGNGGFVMGGGMVAHLLGGAFHIADLKANLEGKLSDATLLLSDQGTEFMTFPLQVAPSVIDNVLLEDGITGAKVYASLGLLPVNAHLLAGAEHTMDTKANLEGKISTALFSFFISNLANEFAGLPAKGTPLAAADTFIIEDSADGNKKKVAQLVSIPGGGTPNVGFYGYRASGSQAIASGVETQVDYQNVQDDPGGDFSTVNDEFTAPTAGRYTFSASGNFTTAVGGRAELRLYQNATRVADSADHAQFSESLNPCVSVKVQMAANDTMQVWAFQNTGFACTLENVALQFSGAQLRTP